MTERKRTLVYAATIVAAALAAHIFSIQNGFVEFDDDQYVYLNPHVTAGLSFEGLRWAFTTGFLANYHPLTWVSHMANVTLFGLDPRGHHATNLVLHSLNAILLFILLWRTTLQKAESCLVALIFAVHPLHVESVAWISERKGLLCAFFVLLALLAYSFFMKQRNAGVYGCVVLASACAFLSKPVAVTLPLMLLLLDFWPLQRTNDLSLGGTWSRRFCRLAIEKIPLVAMAAGFSIATYFLQSQGGAMNPLYQLPLQDRVENALISYARYLWKYVWPTDLSPIYPLPIGGPSTLNAFLATVLLLAITVATWRFRKRAPYALMGWLLFLAVLLPTIGIIQVGFASMADRYTYLPLIGISIALVWTGSDVVHRFDSERSRSMVFAFGFILVAGLIALSQKQTAIWRNSESLFNHAIAVTKDNAEAHAHLGVSYLRENRPADAIGPFERAIVIRPRLKEAHTGLGVALRMTGQPERAIISHKAALEIDPNQPVVYLNLGVAYEDIHNYAEAEHNLREAVRRDPSLTSARAALNRVLQVQGKSVE